MRKKTRRGLENPIVGDCHREKEEFFCSKNSQTYRMMMKEQNIDEGKKFIERYGEKEISMANPFASSAKGTIFALSP